jgi:hypothetical protein
MKTHICCVCQHKWTSATPKEERFVINAVKVNKAGPHCDMCRTGIMFMRYAATRGYTPFEALRGLLGVSME